MLLQLSKMKNFVFYLIIYEIYKILVKVHSIIYSQLDEIEYFNLDHIRFCWLQICRHRSI